ncbi:MAG TPA: hypothetical protein VFH83_12445 [Spirochaetia bacterium]|nr:hypothetical protein [Spirochaetia bacterium]
MKRSGSRILRVTALAVFSVVLAAAAHGQLVISAGANAYAASSGLMAGGGLEAEDWLSVSGDNASRGLMIGLGLQYVALTTSVTHTPGAGWIMPVTLKYGFPVGRDLVLGLGAGAALVIADVDQEDYFGDYYVTSSVGGAPFVTAGLYYFFSGRLNLQAVALAGALFNDAGTVPFLGLQVLVGYYIELPHPARTRDELDDPDDY